MRHSIVIPAFNAAKYLQECLQSVLPQLGANDQVVIVDDGSTDETWSMIQAWPDERIVGLQQPGNTGIAAARNRGLSEVTGDYIHFLDHDDLWPPDRMACIEGAIENSHGGDGRPDIISGWVVHFYCPTLAAPDREKRLLPEPQAASLPGSVVISRDMASALGTFDTALTSGEFVDFLARAQTKSTVWMKVDDVLFYRRIHSQNHTLTDRQASAGYLSVVRRHLARTRSDSARSEPNATKVRRPHGVSSEKPLDFKD